MAGPRIELEESGVKEELAAIRHWESGIRALVDWDPGAALQRLEQSSPGPLSGWSLGVKDIIDVQGMPTGCNVDFIRWSPASEHAAIVKSLLALGAFVLAKTVTTSFAFFDPGVTRNPWNPRHTPGGSSSGSAAAVACGMVRLALGSQTVASVNRPASYCGVVGYKPTYGRLSTSGVFPFSPSVDTLGFFTRGVADMQTAAAALFRQSAAAEPDHLRVGLVPDLHTEAAEDAMLTALDDAGGLLAAEGCTVRAVTLPAECAAAYRHHFWLIAAEAARGHDELFARYGDHYPPKLRELLLQGKRVTPEELRQVRRHRRSLSASLAGLFEEVDVLLSPSAPGPAPAGLARTGDPRFSLLWTYTGCPTLTLPAALSKDGLPLGLQLVGRPLEDRALLAAAQKVESVLRFFARPG